MSDNNEDFTDAIIPQAVITHTIQSSVIEQRAFDGYINATALASAYKQATNKRRDVNHWLEQRRTKETLKRLSQKMGKPTFDLYQILRGSPQNGGGTWIHPDLTEGFTQWLNKTPKEELEKLIQKRLHQELGGDTEVLTLAGYIDLLTPTQIIEIKHVKSWKDGVGKVVLFGIDYPSHQKRLHLFGSGNCTFWGVIERYCKPLNILVTEENLKQQIRS